MQPIWCLTASGFCSPLDPAPQARKADVKQYATLPTFALPPNATVWATAWASGDGSAVK